MAVYVSSGLDIRQWRRGGCELYLTNGIFDLFHSGHISYLKWILDLMRGRPDVLMVGVNSDRAARKLKGPGRPILNFCERVEAVMIIPWVDYVTPIEEDACELIEVVRPDTYVKGGDWYGKPMTEAELVRGYGGRVMYAPFKHGLSTTEIIERVLAAAATGLTLTKVQEGA